MPEDKLINRTFTLPKSQDDWLNDFMDEKDLTRSQIIRAMIRDKMNEKVEVKNG